MLNDTQIDDQIDPLNEQQNEAEAVLIAKSAKRYHERQAFKAEREGLDRREDVTKMIRGAIPLVSAQLTKWLEAVGTAKGRKPFAYPSLVLLDMDMVAFAGLSATFRQIAKDGGVTDIALAIGRLLQVELEARAIVEKDKKAAKKFQALIENASTHKAAQKHQELIDGLEIELGWTRGTQALVGQQVLTAILQAMPEVFEQETKIHQGKKQACISLTDEATTMLASFAEEAAWMASAYEPMLTLPNPWTSLTTGCYHDARLARTVPLVRTYSGEHKRLVRDAIKDGSMQETLDAVNAIQETRWAIDTRVLDVIEWAKEEGLKPSDSFPTTDMPPLERRMTDEEWARVPVDMRSAITRSRAAIRNIRKASTIDATMFAKDVQVARRLAGNEFFTLPHSLDFRGRVYAIPHFNHQRSDHLKSIFRFADGLPLNADGGDWLMIHLANCGDFGKISKQPFDKRIAWVKANELDILDCAENPTLTTDYWGQADSPFCFLQACFEYLEWMRSGFSPDFVSTIAIAMDGSCSGLQHYSALTRSAEEAYHVNLLPRDMVGDIYTVTSVAAVETLTLAASGGDTVAGLVLANGFGRSEVKRNVMTYFYGSARFGMRDQHMEDKMRPLADKVAMGSLGNHPYAILTERKDRDTGAVSQALDGGFSCASVMASHTYEAVVTVAPKADEAATWIQNVAATLAHESLSMIWRTQTGMPVVQRYSEYETKTVNLWLYDRSVRVPKSTDKIDAEQNVLTRVQLLIREAPTKRVDKKRMRSAASPNVIHSMDGAHLQRAAALGKAAGINHFAMIHDSFGTHAGNTTLFARVIREAFVSCYEDYCPLTTLDTYARSVLSDEGIEKLPPIPAKGDLDLNLVMKSLYAFA